jgi:uncharacterized protein YfeS
MSNIAERLRHMELAPCDEAADEIDRLRAEVASLKEELASEQRWASDYMLQLAAANGRVKICREAMLYAEDALAYAAFNINGSKLENLAPGLMESTCPADTALIAQRQLRAALSNLNEDRDRD